MYRESYLIFMAREEEKQTNEEKNDVQKFEWLSTFNNFVQQFIQKKSSVFGENEIIIGNKDNLIDDCLRLLKGVETLNPPVKKKGDNKEDNSLYTNLKNLKDNTDNGDVFKKCYSLLWHCYYIMYIMGPTSKKFLPDLMPSELKIKEEKETPKLFVEEYASTRQIFSKEPIRPFRCLLNLFNYLWNNQEQGEDIVDAQGKGIEGIKGQIIKILLTDKDKYWKEEKRKEDFDERIKNILIYLCAPYKYVPIISQTHKNNILENLSFLIEENPQVSDEDKIKAIGDALEIIVEQPQQAPTDPHKGNPFYDSLIRPFWDTPTVSMNADKDGNLPLNTLLTFKKAIILYGPPGTSKTYTARELAKSVIRMEFAKKMKDKNNSNDKNEKFKEFLNNEEIIFEDSRTTEEDSSNQEVLSHIHRLQLHPNYSYDDFIVGKTIRNNNVDIQKGYLLNLIDKINQDKSNFADLPHIVILDEINRVDISRVFGELFTAMESDYREDGVDIPASIITKNDDTQTDILKLKVPANLYFIGTMNMIDFSLEQVDFALRRRFAWVESNYDKDRLKSIIDYKTMKNEIINLFSENDLIESYISSCTALNDKISNQPNLGPAYEIGHTFFAEIIDIYGDEQFNVRNDKKWDFAKKFLWNISIKPMIEAYCGTMDSKQQEDFIKQCKNTFIPQQVNNTEETDEQ